MASYLDGVEALYALLDGLQVQVEQDGVTSPLTVAGRPVQAAVTYLALPADMAAQIKNDLAVMLVPSRAGWSDDQKATEGHDRVAVDVYGPTADVVREVSRAVEQLLVDQFHDVTGVGFIDDVQLDSRWRIVPDPTDAYARSNAIYRLISRPD